MCPWLEALRVSLCLRASMATSQLLFCAVASASLSSLPAQPRNPAAFLRQAQTRPGSLDSTAEPASSSQPRDHLSLVFVTEEFLYSSSLGRYRWTAADVSLELQSGGVQVRVQRRNDGRERWEALDIPLLRLFHPQIQGK